MACRGVFYAITISELKHVLGLVGDDDALSDAANELYSVSREEEGFQASVDKSWDAMHRRLSDGLLNDIGQGVTSLSRFVLGGRNLYHGNSYIICMLTPEQVQETALDASTVTKQWLRNRFFHLDPRQYDGPRDEDDWEYTWSYFEEERNVYNNAAKTGLAMIFLTDQ